MIKHLESIEENKYIDEIIIKREFTFSEKLENSYVSKIEEVIISVSSNVFTGRVIFNNSSDCKNSRVKEGIDLLLGINQNKC